MLDLQREDNNYFTSLRALVFALNKTRALSIRRYNKNWERVVVIARKQRAQAELSINQDFRPQLNKPHNASNISLRVNTNIKCHVARSRH